MTEKRVCECCNEPFLPVDSDSNDPLKYCSRDCEQDREEFVAALAEDIRRYGP